MTGVDQVPSPCLPGFNIDVTVYDGWNSAVTVEWEKEINDQSKTWSAARRTILELRMLDIMNSLTDKPDWATKIKDDAVRSRWHEEIKIPLLSIIETATDPGHSGYATDEIGEDNKEVVDISADFVMAELSHRAEDFEKDNYTTILGKEEADIVKSDTMVTKELSKKLQSLCLQLANSQPEPWWQPGEEDVVRHLIHPSLYALAFGRTKILKTGVVPLPPGSVEGDTIIETPAVDDHYSDEFQWLPAEVVLNDGKASFTSPINNLDYSEHQPLYEALAELIDCALPLWSRCISVGDRSGGVNRIKCDDEAQTFKLPTTPIPTVPEDGWENRYGEEFDPDDYEDGAEVAQQMWTDHCVVNVCPRPVKFGDWRIAAAHDPTLDLMKDFEKMQVIVKISGIYLTPERPAYRGGSWHVEGLANEHICATAIYYYDVDNIKESAISFRAGAEFDNMDVQYPQSEFTGLERVYGTELRDGEAIQEMPRVLTKEGRLLAFPNVFQHCVSPFELDDSTKPGHRKIIVLWLVNPQKRIISTANVPPQQSSMTREEAIANQKRIMEERSTLSEEYGEIAEMYNFCEH